MSQEPGPPRSLATNPAWIEEQRRSNFEARLPGEIQRTIQLQHHPIIPMHHFSPASAECAECFREGHYYSAISLSQALAEALLKFVLSRNRIAPRGRFANHVAQLRKPGVISMELAEAFERIWEDRNDFHHLNSDVPTDLAQLEQKARDNVQALALIERTIFDFVVDQGRLTLAHPEYWPVDSETGMAQVYLRMDSS